MAFRDIQRIVSDWYKVNVKSQVSNARSHEYIRELVLGIIGASLVVGAVWGYRYYASSKETGAQVAFSESIQIYREALQGKTGVWPHVEMKCTGEYERHKKSSLAPYFLIMKVDALLAQGKRADAQNLIKTVITQLSDNSPLKPLYKTKDALMKLDMPDQTQQASGLDELRALASDKNNKNNDVAQYYLGLYYWSRNEFDMAHAIWKELVASQASERIAASPWVLFAKEKLAQRHQIDVV
jgi:hypothetical protein